MNNENNLKSPQEVMNSFTKATLKLDNAINISSGAISKVASKDAKNDNKIYKLKGILDDQNDWNFIFSRIINLKDTPLYLDKIHCNEVKNVLGEFRKWMYNAKLEKKMVSLKSLTLTIDDQQHEVFSILKSRFLKAINS